MKSLLLIASVITVAVASGAIAQTATSIAPPVTVGAACVAGSTAFNDLYNCTCVAVDYVTIENGRWECTVRPKCLTYNRASADELRQHNEYLRECTRQIHGQK